MACRDSSTREVPRAVSAGVTQTHSHSENRSRSVIVAKLSSAGLKSASRDTAVADGRRGCQCKNTKSNEDYGMVSLRMSLRMRQGLRRQTSMMQNI
eukprot:882892-Rhodomonas_salina.1